MHVPTFHAVSKTEEKMYTPINPSLTNIKVKFNVALLQVICMGVRIMLFTIKTSLSCATDTNMQEIFL